MSNWTLPVRSRVVWSALAQLTLAAGALLLGLTGSALKTGRLDPLDWLLPATIALLLLLLVRPAQGWRAALFALVILLLPIGLLIALAGTVLPFFKFGLLALALTLFAGLTIALARRPASVRAAGSMAIVLLAWGIAFIARPFPSLVEGQEDKPAVAVMTALPLQGAAFGAVTGAQPLEAVGLRSPLWLALQARLQLRPLDVLDAQSLSGVRTVLLAHPRALAPTELVAFDQWVRRGGRALILADPLLHWPDPRPLGHPARAPLTSLLDPLLAHWGLRLAPVEQAIESEPVERRVLQSGVLLQLAGASHFVASGGGRGCALGEQGLLARCRIGAGEARLVADADWIDDRLWTLSPSRPADRHAWTSDAVDQLIFWLGVRSQPTPASWLIGHDVLVSALRQSLLLLLLLVLLQPLVAGVPSLSPGAKRLPEDHKRNMKGTYRDSA